MTDSWLRLNEAALPDEESLFALLALEIEIHGASLLSPCPLLASHLIQNMVSVDVNYGEKMMVPCCTQLGDACLRGRPFIALRVPSIILATTVQVHYRNGHRVSLHAASPDRDGRTHLIAPKQLV